MPNEKDQVEDAPFGHQLPEDVLSEIQATVARYVPEPQFGTAEKYGEYLTARYIVSLYDAPKPPAEAKVVAAPAGPVYDPQKTYVVHHQCVGTYKQGDLFDLDLDVEAMQRLLDLGALGAIG